MTGGIYCKKIEAMKAPHIMRRRVSYMSNGETGDHRKGVARAFAGKTNFWQNVSERIVNAMLMLAKYNLPFCGFREFSKDYKGNFLSLGFHLKELVTKQLGTKGQYEIANASKKLVTKQLVTK